MFRKLIKGLLFGVAFFSLAANCAPPTIQRYPDAAKSTMTVVAVAVVWLPSAKVANEVCAFQAGLDPAAVTIYGCYNPQTGIIYMVEPTSFNDHFGLEVLGHEFWHALGAIHPE